MKLVDELVAIVVVAAPEIRFELIVPLFRAPLEVVRKKCPPMAVRLSANAANMTESDRRSVVSPDIAPIV